MPINPAKLIAAPMLQDFLISKTGIPLAGGIVTMYHDNSRTTLKNWYYQTGSPGTYSYIALPNPLALSAAGTICDANGVDTIPFYYPFSELDENTLDPYFVTVYNASGTLEFTRENFPFNGASGGNANAVNSFNNIIVNNGFWNSIQPNSLSISPTTVTLQPLLTQNSDGNYGVVIAPSQHDGFKMPDIQFIKSNNTGTDILTITPFSNSSSQPILNNIVPEYYINHSCTVAGTTPLIKCYQFPISLHVNTLANVNFTGTIQAQSVSGTPTIKINVLQDTGTGTTSPMPITIQQFTLNPGWTLYTFTGTFPSTAGLTLGNGSDDALYLQVELPEGAVFITNFTKPSIYLTTNAVPTNDFKTYDQVDSIIMSPRTGDLRTSLNSFYPYGWVPMNGGTIGNAASNATARKNADTWPLYNLLWQTFNGFTIGVMNAFAQMLTSAGANAAYGANAILDFNANKAITITSTLGRVLLGSVPVSAMLPSSSSAFTASNNGGNLLITTTANPMNVFNGMPITFSGVSLPATTLPTTVYYVSGYIGTNTFFVSTTFNNAITNVVVGFGAGSGTVTSAVAGATEGEYNHVQSLNEIGQHTHNPFPSGAGNGFVNFVPGAAGTNGLAAGNTIIASSAVTGGINGWNGPIGFNVTQPGLFMNIYIKL